MAKVQRANPVGVDFKIDLLQTFLFDQLTAAPNNWTNYESYPRANKNVKGDNIIPEVSLDPSEYKEVLFNDKFNATSFFLVDDDPEILFIEGKVVHGFSLIFQVKLDKILPAITTHRADEELHVQLTNILTDTSLLKEINGYEIGVENVYSDISIGDFGGGNEGFDDLSEYHVVKYNGTFVYNVTDCKI